MSVLPKLPTSDGKQPFMLPLPRVLTTEEAAAKREEEKLMHRQYERIIAAGYKGVSLEPGRGLIKAYGLGEVDWREVVKMEVLPPPPLSDKPQCLLCGEPEDGMLTIVMPRDNSPHSICQKCFNDFELIKCRRCHRYDSTDYLEYDEHDVKVCSVCLKSGQT